MFEKPERESHDHSSAMQKFGVTRDPNSAYRGMFQLNNSYISGMFCTNLAEI